MKYPSLLRRKHYIPMMSYMNSITSRLNRAAFIVKNQDAFYHFLSCYNIKSIITEFEFWEKNSYHSFIEEMSQNKEWLQNTAILHLKFLELDRINELKYLFSSLLFKHSSYYFKASSGKHKMIDTIPWLQEFKISMKYSRTLSTLLQILISKGVENLPSFNKFLKYFTFKFLNKSIKEVSVKLPVKVWPKSSIGNGKDTFLLLTEPIFSF